MNPKKADILIKNGVVLTMNDGGHFQRGAVAIENERIAAVDDEEALQGWEAKRTIDAKGGIIMPGLVNAHTHAAMTCFRGIADDLPLMTWLNDHIFPAEAQLDIDKVYRGSLLACAEMIMSGTTTFCDMYLFEEAVARAADEAGMRAVVGEVLYDFPSPNYGDIEKGLAYTESMAARYRNHPRISVAVEPHSPYLCAPGLLQQAADLSRNAGILFVIHLSETKSEVETIQERYRKTPTAHLADIGVLGPNVLACHCVALTENDIALLAANDVKVAHNPESNMKLASGIAPIPELIEAGICVGLGTDGCASNNNLDLFSEMDTAAKLHKASHLDPTVVDAHTVLSMATIQGARALGIDDITGSLTVGKRADVIVVDTRKPHLTPLYQPDSHLVYAAGGADVDTTIINGRVVMENRRLLSLDVEEVMDAVNRIAVEIGGAAYRPSPRDAN
jgi:5-methylthioadenosine/S-adenosylhomocysteine deaminase